jgi:hypothetical protein
VPGSLDKKGGRRCHFLLNKRLHLFPLFCITSSAQYRYRYLSVISNYKRLCCYTWSSISKNVVVQGWSCPCGWTRPHGSVQYKKFSGNYITALLLLITTVICKMQWTAKCVVISHKIVHRTYGGVVSPRLAILRHMLKGQFHEIFDPRVFSSIDHP